MKVSVTAIFNKTLSLAVRSLLLLILLFGFSTSKTWGQTYTTRVYADQQNNGATGICIACSVTAPGNAIDATGTFLNTASTLNIGIGVGGAVYQEYVFSGSASAAKPSITSGITLKVGTAAAAVDLSLLSNITLQAYNGTTPVGSPVPVTAGLLNLNLLALGNQTELFFPAPVPAGSPATTYDRVRISIAGLLSVAQTLNVYSAYYTKPASGPVACDKAIDVLTGIVGNVGALGGVTNGQLAVDGNPATFSVLTAAVSLAGYAQETAIFPGLSAPGDSVKLLISRSGSLVDLTLLQNLSIVTYNGSTVVDNITGGNALLVLNLLSGSTAIQTLSFKASGSFDRIQVRMGGLASALTTLNIHEIQRVGPAPGSASGVLKTTCINSPLTLRVSNPDLANLSYTWYDSTGTTVIGNADTLLLTGARVATAGTFKYYVSATRKTCTTESAKTLVTVVVASASAAADITVPTVPQYCPSDTVRITPTSSTVTNKPVFRWYKDNGKVNAIPNGLVEGTVKYSVDSIGKLSISGLTTGTYNYYVSVSDSSHCENFANTLKQVTVTVGNAPNPPTVVPAINASTGVPVTLTAAAVPGASIVWYQDTTAASIATGETTIVGPFATPGTYTYYAAVMLPGGCKSYRVPVVVTITGPVTPGTGCNIPTSQLNGTTLGCVLCSVNTATGSIDNDPATFTTLSAPANLLGGGLYQQLIFPAVGAGTDSIRLDLEYSGGLADLSLLSGIIITSANNNTIVRRDTVSALLSLRLLGGNRFTVTVPTGGAYDRVQVLYKGTLSLATNLNIYGARAIGANPAISVNNLSVCAGSVAQLQATPAAGTSLQWFKEATGGSSLSNQNSYTTDTLRTPGSVKYYIQVIDGNNCPNPERIPVTITVRPLGSPANITVADTTATCANGTAVITPAATGIQNPKFKWYNDANKTSPITNGTVGGVTYAIDSTGKLSVTGLAIGTYKYYVSVSGDTTCENAAGNLKAANVKVTGLPAAPTLTQTYTVSTGLPLTLVAAPAAGATVLWYSDTTQAPIGRGNSITLPAFTVPGTYKYFAGDSLPGGCISNRLLVTVTVTGPIIPTSCNVPTSQVTGTTLGCVLCSVANPTNDIDTDTTNFARLNIPVGLLGGSVYQQLVFPNAGAATDSIRLSLGSPVGLADVSLLGGSVITVYNNNTVVNTYTLSNLLTIQLLNGSRFVATVPAGGVYNKVEVKLTGVANLLNSLDVYGVRAVGANPTIGTTNPVVCQNTKATLSATPAAGTTLQWFKDSVGGTSLSNQNSYTTDTLKTPGTVTYYVQVIGSNNCPNPERIPVLVTVNANGTPADITVADTTGICSGGAAVLTPTSTVTSSVFKWYTDNNKTTQITNGATIGGATFNIDANGKLTVTGLTTGTHTYYVSVSGANRCENTPGNLKAATIVIGAAPAPPTVNQSIAVTTGLPVTLTAAPAPGTTVLWYSDTTLAPIGRGNSITLPAFTVPGIYNYFAGDSLPGGCISNRLLVTITVTGPIIPTSCNVPTSQVTGTTLGCVLCSVANPTNDIDTDTTNFARLNIPVGLLGGSVYQQLVFPNAGAATDSIRLSLGSPVGLADVSLLGGSVITVYNNNTVVNTYTLSNLLTIQLLNGSRFVATVPTGGVYNKVEVKLTGVANLLNSLDVYGVRAVGANPTIQTNSPTVCQNTKATLSATPAAGTTLQWFKDSTGGVALGNQNTYTTDSLKTAGTVTYYVQVIGSNNCPNPERIPVRITVNPLGTPADITLADTTAACGNGPVSLAPAATGVTTPVFKWYTDANKATQITNGAVIGGVTFTVDAAGKLTATGLTQGSHTYYVSVSGTNRCENAAGSLKSATIIITTTPAPPTVAQSITVSTGLPVTLVASPAPGSTVLWYSDTTQAPIGRGSSLVLPPFNIPGVYNYYAGDSITGGCISSRLLVAVNVTGSITPRCNVPNAQVYGTTLGCVLCTVTNPNNDIDTVSNNFTRLNIPVGLLGGSVYQNLIFPNPGAGTDSIRLDLGSPVGLADVNLLGGSVVTVYNNNTVVNTYTLSSVLNLRLLGGNRFIVTVPTGAVYDRVEVKLTGVANLLTSLDIYDARAIGATPTIQTTSQTVCSGSRATLTATPAAGTTLQWYKDSIGGVALSSQNSYTTDTLKTAGTITYYVQVIGSNNCPNPERIPVTVTVNPLGTPGDITVADTTASCGSAPAVLTPVASNVTSPVFKWYTDANKTIQITNGATIGGATFSLDSTGKLTISGLTQGTHTYYVSVSGTNRCENPAGSLKSVTVNVSGAPAAPTVVQNYTISTGFPLTLNATPAPGTTVLWYSDTTLAPIGRGNSITLAPFPAPGIYTYFAGDSLPGGCVSVRLPISITVTGPSPIKCNMPNNQLTGTTLGCVLCSVTNPTNDIDSLNTNFTRLNIPVGLLGGSVYQQLIFPSTGAANDSIRFELANPGGLADVSVLGGALITVYNGTTVVSTHSISNLLTLRLLGGNQYTATIPAGGVYDRVEVKLTGVANLLNSLDIYNVRALVPDPTVTASNVTVCAGQPAVLTATPATGTSIRWYADSTTAAILSSNATYTTDTLNIPGNFRYYVQAIGANGCPNPNRIPVIVTVYPTSKSGDITLPDTTVVCSSTAAVLAPKATDITAPVFKWYKDANKTTAITNGLVEGSVTYTIDTTGKLSVNGLTAGNYTYYVSVSGATQCENPAGSLKAAHVKVASAPASPVVAGEVVIQLNTKTTLTAQAVPGATIVWFNDSTTNTVAQTGLTYEVGPFTTPGTRTYYVAAREAGACDSKRIPVNVQVVGPYNPDPNCNFAKTQASGTTLGCILCSVINPTNDVDSDKSNFTRLSVPVGALGGSVYQRLIFENTGAANDSIQLQMATPVGLADVSLLGGTLISLYNNNTLVKSDTLSNLLTLRLLNGQQFSATIAAPAAYDRVEVKLTGVLNLLNAVDIYSARILYAKPTVNTTTNDTVCINNKATLSVTPAAGTSVRWYADSTSNVVLSTSNTFTTDSLKTAGKVTYYVAVVGGPNSCPNPDRIPVSVTVNPAPQVPGAPVTVQTCPGSDIVLKVNNPSNKLTYNWYSVATGGTKLNTDSGYTFNLFAVTRDTTLYVAAVNSCGAISDRQPYTVQMASSLSAPVVSPNPDTVALGTQAVLTATSNTANVVFKWYGSQAGNDSLFAGPVFTPPTSATAATVTYWVEASLNGGTTCKSIRVPAVVIYKFISPSAVPCEGASSQTVGSGGLLVLGGVYNQTLSVDNDANTASSLVIDAGLLNAQVWQRAKFTGVSAPGDTVRVLLSSPSQVLSAALLGGIQVTSYNGNTPGDSLSINNPLIKLTLLSSKKQALIEFVPTSQFDAVEVKLKSGILGALTTVDFNYAQRALVAPKVQAANVTACAGSTVTLAVQNPVAGITYRWYNSQGVYQAGKDGSTFTTGALTRDTTFYVDAFRNNCASNGRARVDVKVVAAPTAPAVLSNNVEVCAGADAVLAVANPVKGYTYAWYNVAAGGNKLNTDSGFTYKVVNVTAKATYYVEAINDSCNTISATRTAVTVNTASALAPPTVEPQTDTVVIGQQGVFTATAATANAEFNWYNSDTSTNILFTGPIYATQPSTALGRATYWVEAVLPGGTTCKSARVPVYVVTINNNPNQVPCEGATSQTNGVSGLVVAGGVFNPLSAVDNDINTASSLVINVGALNGAVFQKAMFNGTSTPGDTVKVMLSNPGQILSAAVLASVQLTTYNGNTPGDSILVSNPVIHLDLLSNSRRALLSFVPAKPFDAIEVKLKSGVLGALTAIDLNYAQRAIVQPKVQIAGTASVCEGKQVTLNVVNPTAGIVYSWYDNKGIHLLDSVAFVTPSTLDSGTYSYHVTATRNSCTSTASAPVTVTILGLPGAPQPTNNNVTTCINTPVTLSVKAETGVQYNWYDAATGGAKLVTNNNQYTTPANLPAGTYNFFVEAVNASNCANDSGRAKIVLTIDSAATAVDIVANNVTICNGDTAKLTPSSTTVPNPVFKWYNNPDKTGPVTSGVDSKGVLTITGLTPGTYTYYVSVSNNGKCENLAGSLKSLIVTVNSNAVAADVQIADTTICSNSTVRLTATSATVTNPVFKWYQDASLNTLLFTGASYTTQQLTATTSFYVTVEGSNKCANNAADAKVVTVNVREVTTPTIAASSISICVGDTVTLSIKNVEAGLTYNWFKVASGGASVFTGPVYTITGLTQTTDFYAEASAGGCTSPARTKVSVGVGEAPKPILESTDVTVCQGGSAVLKVTSSTNNITYKWYTSAAGGAAIFTGPIYTTGAITANTAYYVEASGDSSNCGKPSARVMVKVTAVPVPGAPVLVSSLIQGCMGQSAALEVKNPTPGLTYQWFDAATNGTLLFEGTVFNIASLDSNRTYYVQASVNGSCPSATRASGSVRVNSIPAVPEITSSSLTVCAGGSVTLSVKNPVAGITYRWYDAVSGGKLLFTGNQFTTGALTANTDFYAESTNGNCSSNQRTKIAIGVGQAPTPTLESNALTVCLGSTATLRVTSATNGITYKWYTQAAGGVPVFTGPVYTTGKLTSSTDYYVEATGDAGACGNPSDRVKASVTVTIAPDAPDVVASSLKTCAGTGVTVAVKTVKPGIIYQWYDAASGGSLLFTGDVYSVPVVTTNTTYYVQANLGGGCSSSTRTAVNVMVDPAPPIPTLVEDVQTTCLGGMLTFSISNPVSTVTYRWYDAPSNGTLLATGIAYTTAPLAASTHFYVEALNSFGCSSARKGVTATLVNTLDAPLADPLTICAGQTAVLAVKARKAGLTYKWYTVARDGVAVFTGGDFTVIPTANAVYFVEATSSGGCISSRTEVRITVNPSPVPPAVANAELDACPGATATLNALNPNPALTYRWYTTASGGTAIATGSSYTTGPVNANQMYYLEATNSNGCPSATRTAVSVIATPAPSIPTITGNENICPGTSTTLTAASTTAGVDFRWYSVATGGTPLFTGPAFTTPPLNNAATYYVEAFTTGGCVSSSRKQVEVTMADPLPAPVITVDNAEATAITFRWNPITGAQRYEVSLDNGVTFIPPSSGANGTTHTISGLQPNQSVSIGVRAIGNVSCETSALASGTGKTTNPNGNNIYVPNLFSPNGDGVNDIEYVYGTAIAQLEFRIYNQWGQLVFTSKDQRTGWDGTMNGRRQPVGVYVYIVRATMQDGTVITKKGNVTLMR